MSINFKIDETSLKNIFKTFKEKFGRSFVSDISTQIKLQTQKAAIDQGGKTLWKDIAKSLETQSTSSSSKLTAKHSR